MPITFRLSEEAEKKLEEMVETGEYPNKSEALREALNLLLETQDMKKRGDRPVLLSETDLEKLRAGADTVTAITV